MSSTPKLKGKLLNVRVWLWVQDTVSQSIAMLWQDFWLFVPTTWAQITCMHIAEDLIFICLLQQTASYREENPIKFVMPLRFLIFTGRTWLQLLTAGGPLREISCRARKRTAAPSPLPHLDTWTQNLHLWPAPICRTTMSPWRSIRLSNGRLESGALEWQFWDHGWVMEPAPVPA